MRSPDEPPAPPDQIEVEPAEPTEPVVSEPEIPELPTPLPPIPPPPSPPSLPPPPAPKPEPVTTEPPLTPFTCQDFSPLPLVESPTEQIIRRLTPNEVTYFWHNLFCDSFISNDPEGSPDCERLIVGTSGAGYDNYYAALRFDLTDLPTANEVESVNLDLHPLENEAFFYIALIIDRLDAEWWRTCPDNQTDWWTLCGDELPTTTGAGSASWGWWNDDNGDRWFRLNITELYRGWRDGTFANYGLMLSDANFFNKLIFASADHTNQQLRPRLVITTKAEVSTLRFPLDGVYVEERISGYRFGDWWLERRCDDSDHGSPRLRHTGIDLHASVGDEVYSIQDGIVRYSQTDSTWGGYVVLEHRGQWVSSYIHVIPMVNVGDRVTRGDPIATIAFGNVNFNPHLHFQVWFGSYDSLMARRGRLPEIECNVVGSPYPQPEPKFPEQFIDPKCLNWE